jgi:LysR substrate binding domain
VLYDRLLRECFRGGLKSPRIVQEGLNEATILSLVSTGMGVGWVLGTARWRCPKSVVVMPVADLNMPLPLALVWRRDNTSPLLASFIDEVQRLPDVRAAKKVERVEKAVTPRWSLGVEYLHVDLGTTNLTSVTQVERASPQRERRYSEGVMPMLREKARLN